MNVERSRRRAVLSFVLLGCVAAAAALAAPPEPPAPAQAAHQVAEPEGLWSRLLRDEPSPVRRLDPTIFTELSPVTASDPAVRLPDDQLENPAAASGASAAPP